MGTDDAEITRLAVAAQHGDRAAAAAFVRATQHQLRRLLGYLSDPGQADDLAQETYLRAFAALPRFEGRSPARMWLLAIARRVAADYVRTARRTPRISAVQEWQDLAQPQAGHEGLIALRQAVRALDPDRREAFVLTRVVGLSYQEAAEVCGCPVGTIRSRVFRARTDLIEGFGEQRPAV
ncbi:sigma-70 family RNA polymerase sigma factor [Kutzneria albida]|uniref:sigma-70 family RNA polymerase sigma factor n=1 Tax=Kutzneria albida TaxID=43357 RepID=UPI00046CA35E|nr:sigma-70 family RNA polymerase sigma factor [Kutzneria albida]